MRQAMDAPRCRRFRERLSDAGSRELSELVRPGRAAGPGGLLPAPLRDLAGHLAACVACAAFAQRLELARQELARPLSSLQPDPLFPARVVARIERPAELIGWAAFRALPAALGLALVLAGAGWLGLAGEPRGPGWLGLFGWLGAPPPPAPPSALVLDGPPSSDQLLVMASQSPEVWP
jgi:hypothetical protein